MAEFSPEVSVVMSVKNGLPYISESIESVLNQSFEYFEFIIVDDGSTDDTSEVIKSFKDSRIKLIQQENTGVAKAKNRGIRAGSAPYIAIIDADDIWLPNKLERQVNFLKQKPDYVLLGGNVQIIDGEGHYLYTLKTPISDQENRVFLEKQNFWTHSSVMYSREAFEKVGGYYEPVRQYIVDYMLMFQLSLQGKVHQLDEAIVKYRIAPSALSAKTENPEFKEIMIRSVKKGKMTDQELARILEIKSKEDRTPNFKTSMYHLFLGRSYMFHNYQPKKSKFHLKKAFHLNKDLKIAVVYLVMVSLLPYSLIKRIYNSLSPLAENIFLES